MFLGLTLQLVVRQFDYVHLDALSAGVRLVVHSPTDMPFPESQGVYLAPGFTTGIAVTMVNFDLYPYIVQSVSWLF